MKDNVMRKELVRFTYFVYVWDKTPDKSVADVPDQSKCQERWDCQSYFEQIELGKSRVKEVCRHWSRANF